MKKITPSKAQFEKTISAESLFSTLSPATIHQLAQSGIWRTYNANEIVFSEGDQSSMMYYIQSGWIKAVKTGISGREQVLHYLGPGEMFNEIGLLAAMPSPATAIALEPVGMWGLGRDRIQHLIRQQPDFADHLIKQLAHRVLHLASLIGEISLKSVNARLAGLLLAGAKNNALQRPRWYTQTELAARLGTVPDVIQRSLRRLEKEGLITVSRDEIKILAPQKLAALAQ